MLEDWLVGYFEEIRTLLEEYDARDRFREMVVVWGTGYLAGCAKRNQWNDERAKIFDTDILNLYADSCERPVHGPPQADPAMCWVFHHWITVEDAKEYDPKNEPTEPKLPIPIPTEDSLTLPEKYVILTIIFNTDCHGYEPISLDESYESGWWYFKNLMIRVTDDPEGDTKLDKIGLDGVVARVKEDLKAMVAINTSTAPIPPIPDPTEEIDPAEFQPANTSETSEDPSSGDAADGEGDADDEKEPKDISVTREDVANVVYLAPKSLKKKHTGDWPDPEVAGSGNRAAIYSLKRLWPELRKHFPDYIPEDYSPHIFKKSSNQ
jgi:hypothetical protein